MFERKGIVIGIITAAAVSVGAVGVFAAGAGIAKTNSIGEESAKSFAYTDAGVEAADVLYEKTDFEFERGKYVYDIEFRTLDAEYDYTLDAGTGEILEKGIESAVKHVNKAVADKSAKSSQDVPLTKISENSPENASIHSSTKPITDSSTGSQPAAGKTTKTAAKSSAEPSGVLSEKASEAPEDRAEKKAGQNSAPDAGSPNSVIGIDAAKQIALADAGLKEEEVVFSAAKQDSEDGAIIYEVGFFVKGTAEYDYDVNAYTGEIKSKSIEPWEPEDGGETDARNSNQTYYDNGDYQTDVVYDDDDNDFDVDAVHDNVDYSEEDPFDDDYDPDESYDSDLYEAENDNDEAVYEADDSYADYDHAYDDYDDDYDEDEDDHDRHEDDNDDN